MTIKDILDCARASGQTERFTRWLAFVLSWEAVFEKDGVTLRNENVPGDSGGLTFCGIDKASHPHFPYDNPHPFDVVAAYLSDAWKPCHAEELGFPSGEVTANFAVNMGLEASILMLQFAIDEQSHIVIDGALGPITIKTVQQLNNDKLAEDIEAVADAKYRRIAYLHPVDRKFLSGWLARDAALDRWWKKLSIS